MAFSERCEYKVEILPDKTLQVRRTDIIEKDGRTVGTSFHRHVLTPGSDVSAECDCVKAIAPVLWTPEVVSSYVASIEEDNFETLPSAPPPVETDDVVI